MQSISQWMGFGICCMDVIYGIMMKSDWLLAFISILSNLQSALVLLRPLNIPKWKW